MWGKFASLIPFFFCKAFLQKHDTAMTDLSSVSLAPGIQSLVEKAKGLYQDKLKDSSYSDKAWVTAAPGRVNLIGEHTDYTEGFVFPLGIELTTVVYGTGNLKINNGDSKPTTVNMKFVSATDPGNKVEEVTVDSNTNPPEKAGPWTWYVAGTIMEYIKDLPQSGAELNLAFAIAGDVPLGSGLSSSASLEVAVARFLEEALGDYAFKAENDSNEPPAKTRALRCQKAENVWCHSPCGIMDQYIISAASSEEKGTLLLIDCRTNDFEVVKMKQDPKNPVALVVANSAVTHSIGGGEYPKRVQQCKEATQILRKVHGDRIKTLRDATVEDVLNCQDEMDDVIYRRARHVVTENARVVATKEAVKNGEWKVVGQQMSLSHSSMRDDYETSCEEVDILVNLAQKFPGVWGSRLTGGGFGGCCVTLVAKDKAEDLMNYLQTEYKKQTGKDCAPFETMPAPGARLLGIDPVN